MKAKLLAIVLCGLALSSGLAASVPSDAFDPFELTPPPGQALQVGEYMSARFDSPHPYTAGESLGLVWSQEIFHPGATYIAPFFRTFELADGDYVIVRAPDWSRSWRYEKFGKAKLGRRGNEGFWGIHITGERAVIELYARGARGAFGVEIDRYARGFTDAEISYVQEDDESICTGDDKENAVCYDLTEPTVYERAQTVARLLIQGASLCTGWLIGDEGHLMTNEHCISSDAAAMNTDYEFGAEGATCATSCPQLQCDGIVEAVSGTLVQDSVPLDYALVQLPVNLSGTYGFLQFRDGSAVLDERIYSAQHPGGRGKEIALFSTYPTNESGFAEVDGLMEPVCDATSVDPEVGYFMDTEGGSSGSPVLGYSDHFVVALHHCRGSAFCTTGVPANDDPNRGVPPAAIIADLGANLPNNAIGDAIAIFSDGFESGDTSSWTNSVP